MAANNTIGENTNPVLDEVVVNLNNFIDNINCLSETFNFSVGMLRLQLQVADKKLNDLVSQYTVNDEKGNQQIDIPGDKIKEYNKLEKRKRRAEKAISLIPPTYIVSLVSLFDSFLAGIVRCIYNMKQDLLLESNKNFTYRDLVCFETIKEAKKSVIDDTIDKLFRDSHTQQIEWIEKAIDVKTLKLFSGWGAFIELTERRNLFVHSDGVVSSQYLNECKKNKYDVSNLEIGSRLSVDSAYFRGSYNLLYEMAIMLTQILINKLYIGKFTQDTGVRDKILIGNVYELICDKHYDIAIFVSMFVRDEKIFKRNHKDRTYIELNLAQAYKWAGKNDECLSVLQNLDTSAMSYDLLIPKMVLEDKYDEVYSLMKRLGATSEILTKEAYREWPIFRELRKQDKFKEIFQEVFDEPLCVSNVASMVEESFLTEGEIAYGVVE